MRKIEIDFWNSDSVRKGISQIYNVPEFDIIHLIVEFHKQREDLLSAFFERYNIHPDVHSLEEVFIKCKLIGKYPDKELLETKGLMSFMELLKRNDSFLVCFLKKESIHIDVDELIFQFHKK